MASKGDWGKLFVGLALVGITAYVIKELLQRKPGTQVQFHKCPKCGRVVKRGAPYCWYCKIPLSWESTPPTFLRGNIVVWAFIGLLVGLGILRFVIFAYFPPPEPTVVSCCDRAFFLILGIFGRQIPILLRSA